MTMWRANGWTSVGWLMRIEKIKRWFCVYHLLTKDSVYCRHMVYTSKVWAYSEYTTSVFVTLDSEKCFPFLWLILFTLKGYCLSAWIHEKNFYILISHLSANGSPWMMSAMVLISGLLGSRACSLTFSIVDSHYRFTVPIFVFNLYVLYIYIRY